MEFRILGPLEVSSDGGPVPLGGGRQRAVLALLLLRLGEVVSTEQLLEELWAGRPPATATKVVQLYVSRLRKRLGDGLLLTRAPGYVLRVDPENLDAHRFVRLFEKGREALARGSPELAAGALREALSLWHGPALADFRYEPFAQGEIARLEDLRLACMEERIEADLALGADAELTGELEALVSAHPLRESLRGQLMLALYRSGRQAEALAAYQAARQALVDGLGIEPSPSLQRLERAILDQEPVLDGAPERKLATADSTHDPTVDRDLPSGTVSFLFTDVEGSTRLLQEMGSAGYAEALATHRRVLRNAFDAHGGLEVDARGDDFFVVFPTASGALAAAAEAMKGLAGDPIRVRMGIHTGSPHLVEDGYVGVDVHRAARIAACGHGGQVLVSASTAALLPAEGLRDLGVHRLKDLSAPERIYQLGLHEFPPLKSLYRTNLPIPATSFLGRRRELAEVLALMGRDDLRLLTLTGPGGTGKTRLALQAASEASERFPDGVFWVPLAPLRDSKLVLETAAQALDAKGRLDEHIADKSLLILFDNFEHVVDAADDLPGLVAACPNLELLVTSRELLRLPGEQAYPVPPLEPDDGAELFLARARAALPSFTADEAVPELCSRLEQLPLALELAAARVGVIAPDRLLERLSGRLDLLRAGRGVDPRQQTLRATIEWSHVLLSTAERRLFASLAVFAGGCTLDAAEKICDADLDTLQSLVDKSLVRVRDGRRFWMLETIREYAAEQLEHWAVRDVPRRRHAEYFLALAEETEPNLIGIGSRKEWLEPLERDHDNLRAAMDWFEASGESDRVMRFAAALWRFWDLKGHLVEGRFRVDDALRSDDRPTPARAKALSGAADMALTGGDIPAGGRLAREALELHHELGDAWGAAFSRLMVAYATGQEGDWPRAQELFGESVRQFRELGDQHYALRAARAHAWSYYEGGDLERARALYEEIIREAREAHDPFPEGIALTILCDIALDQGRHQDAVLPITQGYQILRDLGDLLMIGGCVCRFARILALSGRPGIAARLLSCSSALLEEIGAMPPHIANIRDQTLATVRPQLDEAAFHDEWAKGQALTADEAVALALDALN